MDPHCPALLGPECVWVIEVHTFIYKMALKYFEQSTLIGQSLPSPDNPSSWISEEQISKGTLSSIIIIYIITVISWPLTTFPTGYFKQGHIFFFLPGYLSR